mgnify:CR=1 FL=1
MTRTARGRAPKDAARAKLYAVAACQGTRCGRASIRWVPTDTGNPIPLDAGRDPHGPIVVDQHPTTRAWIARAMRPDDREDRPRYSVHWSTCHHPELYREVKLAADPRGEFPSLTRAAPPSLGWCSVCGKPREHVETVHLCLDCARAAVARWSPAMAPTIAQWTPAVRRLLQVPDLTDHG